MPIETDGPNTGNCLGTGLCTSVLHNHASQVPAKEMLERA